MDLQHFVDLALDEDLGHGDVTTDSTVPMELRGEGTIIAKEALVVAGHEVAGMVFARTALRIGGDATYTVLVPEGQPATPGEAVAHVAGTYAVLLTGERVALNLLMRMSGIATRTRDYVDAAGDTDLRVVDTRKTTPLLRQLEKAAVRAGGGHNHRFALFDGVLIKDNHIAAVGGDVAEAIRRARDAAHHLLAIEVEVTTLEQLQVALRLGADAVLLDNMDDATLAEAVRIARELRPEVVLEASGNITPERIRRIRHLGLDIASAGGLIHQARWVDLSMGLRLARS